MPPCKKWLEGSKRKLEGLHWQGVETLVTSSFKKRLPHGTILYNKMVRMIFREGRIVRS
jgi:hypothetical protein